MKTEEYCCAACGKELCSHWRYRTNGVTCKCLVCGEAFDNPSPINYFAPMYEGEVVNPDTHEWGGYDACKECSDQVPVGK